MGLCLGKTPSSSASPSSPHWPHLPPEIAGHILSRLRSHDDRLSFGAVCPEWRLAARQHGPLQPPAMPCINLGNGTYQSITGGKVLRFATPKGYRAGASFGGWLFYYKNQGSGRCFLRAPLSGDAIEVPINYHRSFLTTRRALRALPDTMRIGRDLDMKIVVCSSQLAVAIIRPPARPYFHPISYFASFRPALRQRTSSRVLSFALDARHGHHHRVYTDIAFYHGNLFALTCWEGLYCHDMDGHPNHLPIIYHGMESQPATLHSNCYLVISSDKKKLFMVRWRRRGIDAMDVWVFTADFGTSRWVEVKDLGDQVLFLGRNCSMAFVVCSLEHWGRSFLVGRNRVFVLGTEWASSLEEPLLDKSDIPSYCVYDMMSRESSLVRLDGARYLESCTVGWFFP